MSRRIEFVEVFMEKENPVFITTAESVLLVGTFVMWIFIGHFIAVILEFKHIFEANTWWYLLPLITFILFLSSFVGRRKSNVEEQIWTYIFNTKGIQSLVLLKWLDPFSVKYVGSDLFFNITFSSTNERR